MRVGLYLSLVFAFLVGCVCVFTACNRQVLVAGHVSDSQHRPLGHATVDLNGVKKETDDNGCFYFGEVPGSSEMNLRVAKVGHRQYQDSKALGTYNIVVTLVQEDSDQQSSAVWQRSIAGEMSKYKNCSE